MRLYVQIVLCFSGLILLFTFVLTLGSESIIQKNLVSNQIKQNALLVEVLADTISIGAINGDIISTQDVLTRIVKKYDLILYAYITDFDGRIFVHTFEGLPPRQLISLEPVSGGRFLIIEPPGIKVLHKSFPMIKGMEARVHLGISQEGNFNFIKQLRTQTIVVLIVIFILGVVIVGVLANLLTRPLGQLIKNIRSYGRGERTETIKTIERTKEYAELTNEFNQMIEQRMQIEEKVQLTQKQLLYAQKLAGIGEMAAGVSHEVLNPLNIISVHTQMLQRNTKNDASIQSFCNKVKLEIERINKIVNSLLEFSRMGKPELGKIDIKDEIEKTIALVEENYKLDNIEIVRDWCENPAKTKCDPDKIRQVFVNLLQNAKYAMPQGGTITMGCRVVKGLGDQSHQIIFSDTGAGMSKDVQSKIFEPFFTTKPVNEGTGMGLAVVHGIIEEHGGTISVESDEGKGTTFIISLPLA